MQAGIGSASHYYPCIPAGKCLIDLTRYVRSTARLELTTVAIAVGSADSRPSTDDGSGQTGRRDLKSGRTGVAHWRL